MANVPTKELLQLSIAERIQLVQDLWDSIAAKPSALELTENQRAELDRRLGDHAANPESGRPWEEVRERLTRSTDDSLAHRAK